MTDGFDAEQTNVDYTDGRQACPDQFFNLFRPVESAPAKGYPLLIDFKLSGFVTQAPPTRIDESTESTALGFLEHGFKVASVSCTSVEANPADVKVTGNGLWHPPEQSALWLDHDRPMSVKDAIMVIQHMRHHASTYAIDPDRIVVHGWSAAAVAMSFAVLGPDRAGSLGTNPQDLESSHVRAVILREGPFWFDMLHPIAGCLIPFPPMGSTGDVPASSLDDVDQAYKDAFSALLFYDPPDGLPIYLHYHEDDPGACPLPPILVSQDFRVTTPVTGVERNLHSPWFGYTLKGLDDPRRKLGHAGTRLVVDQVVDDAANAPPGQTTEPDIVPDAILPKSFAAKRDMPAWGTLAAGPDPFPSALPDPPAPKIVDKPLPGVGPKVGKIGKKKDGDRE